MSRQNYYLRRQRRQRRQVEGELVAELVKQERRLQPRLGGRKLYHMLQAELEGAGVKLGRDRFFEELAQRGLLVPPLAAQTVATTNSEHCLPVFHNLAKDKVVRRPNELWVSDLTYIRTAEGFLFLALITDRFSRKIVGEHLDDTLESLGCVLALEQALAELPAEARPMHHSDRGCQYCCHEYTKRLRERGLAISMTELDHCAENALAERVNGILKQEYGLGGELPSKRVARNLAPQAIELYNTRRPHSALGYRCPAQVHAAGACEKARPARHGE
jgi:putative transposase